MGSFVPGLLDRLMGAPQPSTVEQVKDSVARDLEALLNTRLAIPSSAFDGYPLARASVLDYGLADFGGMCLASSEDREAICASIKRAIETHEPRLTDVAASIQRRPGAVNRLDFVITAKLQLDASSEPVNFNAVLQPSSLRYSVSGSQRQQRPAMTKKPID